MSPLVSWYDANSTGARELMIGRGLPRERFGVIGNGVNLEMVSRALIPRRIEDCVSFALPVSPL